MATSKEYHDYLIECLSKAGDITTKKMMGEYCIYFQGKLIGDLCDNRLLIKQTDTSNRILKNCKLEFPYKGSKTLMYVVEDFEDSDLIQELLDGLYAELPEPKKKKK